MRREFRSNSPAVRIYRAGRKNDRGIHELRTLDAARDQVHVRVQSRPQVLAREVAVRVQLRRVQVARSCAQDLRPDRRRVTTFRFTKAFLSPICHSLDMALTRLAKVPVSVENTLHRVRPCDLSHPHSQNPIRNSLQRSPGSRRSDATCGARAPAELFLLC